MEMSTSTKSAPKWLALATYILGLLFTLLGERVLATRPFWQQTLLVMAALSVLGSAALRFLPASGASAERRRIEQMLGWLTIGTALFLAVAVAAQHQPNWFGLRPELPTDVKDRREGIISVLWFAGLLCTVVPHLFAQAALYPMSASPRPETRRVLAAALAGLSLALVVVYGGLFVYSASKLGITADYSYFKTAKPSSATRRIGLGLKEPVRVVALFPAVSEVRREVERYLGDLSRGVPKLRVEYHDRLLEPKVARELRATQDGVIVLSRGEVRQTISVGVEQKNARTVLRNLDQEFQKNLMKLSRDAKVAYFTTGHGELNDRRGPEVAANGQGVQIFKKILETQNFKVQDLGAAQGLVHEVPGDADVVVVLGPSEPFSHEEVVTLDTYVRKGGHLLLALDVDGRGTTSVRTADEVSAHRAPASKPDTATKVEAAVAAASSGGVGANVEDLARLVGVGIEPGVLANDRIFVQRRFNKSDYTQLVTNRFSSHASVSTLNRSNGSNIVFFGTGALKKLDATDKNVAFVVHAMAGTYLDVNNNFELDGTEARESHELVAAVARALPDASKGKTAGGPSEMRAIVMGDADAASDLVLMNAPANRLLLVDAMRWLVGEESFSGEISTEEDVRIQHTKEKNVLWFYCTILGAPALVLGLGLYIVRRSRANGGRA